MTIWQPDLTHRSRPVYLAIADALAEDVHSGALPHGTRMPTHRDLAHALGVTIGTVSRAYAEAERRGLIAGHVGRGTFVRLPGDPPSASADADEDHTCFPELSPPTANGADETAHGGTSPAALSPLDLSLNYPAPAPLADAVLAGVEAIARREVLDIVAGYQPANGLRGHRAAGAEWINATTGETVPPDEVLVVPGCQGGISMALTALCRPGDVILHEDLTWPGLQAAASILGVRTLGVAMDGHGLVPEALDAACREHAPRVLYTMPTLHNPKALVMPVARRQEIAAVVRRHRVAVIEDDVYGFLLDEPLPPLRTFAPDLVIYATSLSKAVAPGLRIGYLWAPPALVARLSTAIRMTVLTTSPIAGAIATAALRSGAAAAAAHRQRNEARRRQTLAAEILAGLDFATHPCAFHGWLAVPAPWQCNDFIDRLRDRGVLVTPGSAFAVSGHVAETETHVRLCLCAVPTETSLAAALRVVAETAISPCLGPRAVI